MTAFVPPYAVSFPDWIRLASNAINPLLAAPVTYMSPLANGAVGDAITDDTTAVQNTINTATALGVPVLLPPKVKLGSLTLPAGTKIVGAKTTITAASGSYPMFTITGSDVTVQDLIIQNGARTGGYDFTIACGTSTIDRTTLRNIVSFGGTGFITDSGSGSGKHVTTILDDLQARSFGGPGVSLTRLFGYGAMNRVSVDFIGVSASNYTAFMVDGSGLGASAGGLTMIDCNAGGTAGVYTNTSQIGYDLKNFSDITIVNARADSMGGNGFQYTSCNKLEIEKALAQLCDGHGHVLTTVTNSDIDLLRTTGRNGLSGSASKDGVQIVSGCFGLSIERIFSRDMTGNGLNVAASQAGDLDVGRVQMLSNTGWGIITTGTTAVNIGGGQTAGNTAGNLSLGGSLHYVDNIQLSSGAKGSYGPGPVTA